MTAKYTGEAFRTRYGPWAVVAGGSDGIGAAYAHELARRGLHVALIARNRDKLARTATELSAQHGVDTRSLSVDLTAEDAATRIAAGTGELDVGLLVYNAGANRRAARFLELPVDEALWLMQLNCRGPLLLSHAFGARLRERGRGGIVLMSSMACFAGASYQATYCAVKAFVTTLAEGLWHELAPEGVDVLGCIAGATRTESVLHQSDKFEGAMAPDEVATGALDHLGKGPTWVPGAANQAAARGLSPTPRVPLVNGMSQACAELFELPHTPVEGVEFHQG